MLRLDMQSSMTYELLSGTEHFDLDVLHFIRILEKNVDPNERLLVSAADADALVSGCDLLVRIGSAAPEIVAAPLRRESQFWTATGKPAWVDISAPVPSEDSFVDACAVDIMPSTKPFGVGLFTSTGVGAGRDMWTCYLESSAESSMFPRPWHRWRITPSHDARVYEITSAAQWVEFVVSYPLHHQGLIYPDWKSIARNHDAVHMTLPAIASTQGICMQTNYGTVAAPYWSVESTFWLHWCFESAYQA